LVGMHLARFPIAWQVYPAAQRTVAQGVSRTVSAAASGPVTEMGFARVRVAVAKKTSVGKETMLASGVTDSLCGRGEDESCEGAAWWLMLSVTRPGVGAS
jgi:hypothetical protein